VTVLISFSIATASHSLLGAHRFTFAELNLVVAATDLPNSNDREKLKQNILHYSQLRAGRVYGLEGVYVDRKLANEDILLFLESEYNDYNFTA
jgi:hypothetical protein